MGFMKKVEKFMDKHGDLLQAIGIGMVAGGVGYWIGATVTHREWVNTLKEELPNMLGQSAYLGACSLEECIQEQVPAAWDVMNNYIKANDAHFNWQARWEDYDEVKGTFELLRRM